MDETPPPGCFLGYAADRYDFTLTQAADVTVEVADRFNAGDRYEARCNNRNLDEDGNGDFNNHGEDCIFGREDVDVGVEVWANLGTVTLDPGDWSIRIREFELQCGTFFDPLARIDHRFGNEGDFGRPERFSESFAIDPVQVE